MKNLKMLIFLSILALSYNFFLLLSVVFNLDWAKSRAAGGSFESFPIWVRILDAIFAIFMIFIIRMLWNHREKPMSGKGPRIARIIGYTFIFSTFLQLISRSANERWNAIPAAIIATTLLLLSRREFGRTLTGK